MFEMNVRNFGLDYGIDYIVPNCFRIILNEKQNLIILINRSTSSLYCRTYPNLKKALLLECYSEKSVFIYLLFCHLINQMKTIKS